jgi:uncharacterized protein (DUF2062 family)
MFRRRKRQSSLRRAQEFIWPRRGWKRAGRYIWHRLQRLPGTPHSIAIGFALGCSLSVTPLVGIHFFIAALLAWLIRGNVVASAFGTLLGNPWTFPIIWLTTYHLGQLMLGNGLSLDNELDFTFMFTGLIQSMIEADGALFLDQVWPIWMPMFLGSVPSALFTGVVVYAIFYRLTESYQSRRHARLERRVLHNASPDRKPDTSS